MNYGNESWYCHSGEDNELHDINVTPFIDVMLVLLDYLHGSNPL